MQRTLILVITGILLARPFLLPEVAGQSRHRDAKLGYSIAPPPKLEAVPVEPNERFQAARWSTERVVRDLRVTLEIYTFAKAPPEGEETPAAAPPSGPEPGGPPEVRRDVDLATWKSWVLRGLVEDPKGRKEIALKGGGKAVARISEHSRAVARRGTEEIRGFFLLAEIATPERDYLLRFACDAKVADKQKPDFLQAIHSFRLIEVDEVLEEESAETLRNLTPKERALRQAALSKVIKGWWSDESAHYVYITNLKPNKRELLREVKTELELIRRVYEKDFPAPATATTVDESGYARVTEARGIEAVSLVRICADRDDYHQYGGPGGSAGYWNAGAEELVLYAGVGKDQLFAVLRHEAFHQYIYYCFGNIAPHSWYNEGYGDYYAGARREGRNFRIEPFRWRTETIRSAARAGTHVPLKDIIRYTQAQYYARPDLCYAEGWSLIYFLRQGAKDPRWREILPRYMSTLHATHDLGRAVDRAFEGVDLDALEGAWRDFIVKGMNAP